MISLLPQGHIVVCVTAPDSKSAAKLVSALVEERLAACGTILGRARSIYRWKGKVEEDPEVLLILKTRAALFERLRKRVVELHAYEVPEVIALPVIAGHQPYLDWINENTGKSSQEEREE